MAFQSTIWVGPSFRIGAWPMKMFSATESSGYRLSSWYIVAIPAACASWGLRKRTSWPSMRIRPESGKWTPEMTLMSVDLPAPFSPTSACTWPASVAKWTSSSALTPGNDFEMFSSSSKAVMRPRSPLLIRASDAPTALRRHQTDSPISQRYQVNPWTCLGFRTLSFDFYFGAILAYRLPTRTTFWPTKGQPPMAPC